MKHVCYNCKWSRRAEDDCDTSSDTGRGRRVYWDCMHTDAPIMATVVERESNPKMKESKSFVHKFGCNLWEKR